MSDEKVGQSRQYPGLHMNGSGPKNLHEKYQKAALALSEALSAMREAWPHGRDYYLSGDDALQRAEDEAERLMTDVREAMDYFEALDTYVYEQEQASDARRFALGESARKGTP